MTREQNRKLVIKHGLLLTDLPFQVTADIYDGRFKLALDFLRTYVGNRKGSRDLQADLEKLIS